jgi:DNA-binding beta-propeller fold protein YncE
MTRLGRLIGGAIAAAILAGSMMLPSAATAATSSFSGAVDAEGDRFEQHLFDVAGSGEIQASLAWSTNSANLNLFLYRKDGDSWTSVAKATTGDRPESITFGGGSAGQWKVGVKAVSGASVYEVSVTYPGGSSPTPISPTFVTVIGGGSAGHASMYPSGVDVDGAGNVYVADTGDDTIERYAPDGFLVWKTGSRGPRAPGRFENPRDVAFLNGKVYVADTGYNRVQVLDAGTGDPLDVWSTRFGSIMGISAGVDGTGADVILVTENTAHKVRVFTTDGTLIRSIGDGPGSGAGQLNQPRDAATDADGNVYVADYKNSRVAVFGPGGRWIGAWGVNGTGPGQFKRPYGIDLDGDGDVYVADSNNYIHRFDWNATLEQATFVRAYGSPGEGAGRFSMLRRVAVGSGSIPKVYGADLWTYKVEVFGAGGAHLQTIGGQPPATGAFNEPYGIAVDGSRVFVVDMVNQRVQRFANGTFAFQLAWGERGWGEGNSGFNWPKGITLSTNGGAKSVWVADTKNNRVSEFWPDGTPTGRKFGKVGAAVGQLRWPFSVAAFGTRLVVADSNNNRVQLWNPAGPTVDWTVTTAAGLAFGRPKAVSVSGGLAYVADTQNDRVVVLDAADGSFVRAFGSADLAKADGVAVEPDTGDVWVSDSVRHRLVEFTSTGTWRQNFGGLGSTPGRFNRPYHLAIHRTGTGTSLLFVVDSWNDRVQVFRIG